MGNEEILSLSLCRKLSLATHICRRQVGVLVDRRGEIRWVIVGDATQIYLPDIGRVRGGTSRLRGLRLFVARPTPLSVDFSFTRPGKKYCLTKDLKTDLEKLRLDCVFEIDASKENSDGPLVLGFLSSELSSENKFRIVCKERVFKNCHEIKETFAHFIGDIERDIEKSFSTSAITKKAAKHFFDRGILVGVYQGSKKDGLYSMQELVELARSAKVEVVDQFLQFRAKPNAKTLVGSGKLEEICLHALSVGVELIIFDCDLTPSQLMHITDLTDLKILDRTMLILDIFAQRATTREGKMQVEMAQLSYSLPRLAQKQSGLSRLTGGIGGRGPGETKLDVNKRRVKEKLARLADEMKRIARQRDMRKKVRRDRDLKTLAIVGYTNAGKSTLLNSISKSDIYAKDELFATLDPHSRRVRFPKEQEVIATDTVGFINHLPKTLMKAFMATLEELNDADVLLHVVDISDENFPRHIKVVEKILDELGLSKKKKILIYNKIDRLEQDHIDQQMQSGPGFLISAKNQQGLDKLLAHCEKILSLDDRKTSEKITTIPTNQSKNEIIFDGRRKD